jgi:hypothetical protein
MDYGCFLHFGGDFAVLDLQAIDELDIFLFTLGQQAFNRLAADAEMRFDALGDRVLGGQYGDDAATQRGGGFVQRVKVERVGGGY